MTRICILPQVSGVGGMVSFRAKFAAGLNTRGIEITPHTSRFTLHAPRSTHPDAILIIGGTRDLPGLWRAKRRGVRIVQRLDGMNWLHRQRHTGVKHYLRSEYGNWLLQFIRSWLADRIVYQSEFSRSWWQRVYGPTQVPNTVVHNAVDLNTYTPNPQSTNYQSTNYQILLVEGSLMGGYEMGLETAVALVERINSVYSQSLGGRLVELTVVGRVTESVKRQWNERTEIPLIWAGLVSPDRIPEIDRSAHLLYSSDINAACPNAVIEALACGLPVLAFDTGALPELVTGDSGRVVPYGSDPWKLDPPDVTALAEAAVEILTHQDRFRTAARARAEEAFRLDAMVDGYLAALM